MEKLYERIDWHNDTTPALNETNLNLLSKAVDDIDDRVVELAGVLMEDVPQIIEYMSQAEDLVEVMEQLSKNPPYIGANGHWYVWDTNTNAFVDSGIDASISVDIADITMLNPSASPYVTNTGTDTDPIFHLYIPRGQTGATGNGIQSIAKTGTSGAVDTYTITMTNGSTTTFTVTNGTGSSAGEITYDNTSSGIPASNVQQAIDNFTDKVVNNEPYVFRQGKGNMVDLDLVGASVVWNQQLSGLVSNDSADGNLASNRCTDSYDSTTKVHTLTALENTGTSGFFFNKPNKHAPLVTGHKYLQSAKVKSPKVFNFRIGTNDALQTFSSIPANVYNTVSGVFLFGSSSNEFVFNFNANNSWSGSESVYITELMLIDLTQMFGSTIADYIYSLEQATAGAGVAWFRQYFPNAYYDFDNGSIKSVNPSSREVVGKNLLQTTVSNIKSLNTSGTWSNNVYTINNVSFTLETDGGGVQRIILNGTASNAIYFVLAMNKDVADIINLQREVIINGCPSGGSNNTYQLMYYKYMGTANAQDFGSGSNPFIPTSMNSDGVIQIIIRSGVNTNGLVFEPMIRLATVADATYEPYQEYSYNFDTSKQLRGIFKLDANHKLYADGDIYTADGSITRKYGIVDLGTLDWTYQSDVQRFYSANLQNVIKAASNSLKANIITSKYLTVDANSCNSSNDKTCAVSASKNILICDLSYSDATLFKSALDGVYLVYEKATPTTESAKSFQSPQRAFTNGTEEFIDAGVITSTRDVSIPVGNNSTYYLSVALPPIEDFVDGAIASMITVDHTGVPSASATKVQRIGVDGVYTEIDGTKYMETIVTLSTAYPSIVNFSNSAITSLNAYDIYTSIYGMSPTEVLVGGGNCQITFPKYTSAVSMTVRLYIR